MLTRQEKLLQQERSKKRLPCSRSRWSVQPHKKPTGLESQIFIAAITAKLEICYMLAVFFSVDKHQVLASVLEYRFLPFFFESFV